MFYSDSISSELYSQLMEQIKTINSDWLSLRKSKQYRLGLVIVETFNNIRCIKFHSLLKSLRRWSRGMKSRRIVSFNTKNITDNKQPNYFSLHRIAIYTAIFGDYDKIPEPYFLPDNCDFYIFTDQDISINSVWKKKECPNEIETMTNAEKNRYIKMHPHKIFTEYDYSIYVDGNIHIITDLTEYVNKLNDIGLGIHLHNTRQCIYKELETCVKTGRFSDMEAKRFRKILNEKEMPEEFGLLQCSVIVREHKKDICIHLMNEWWNMYKKYGKRDQLYLPFVLFMNNIPIDKVGILGNDLYSNPSFRITNHI